MKIISYDSPVGKLTIATQNNAIIAISFSELNDNYLTKLLTYPEIDIPGNPNDHLESQLETFFSGKDPHFSLHLQLHGTKFQQKVWTACASIPYGETRSYSDIAHMIENPKAVRAVGTALSQNPIPLIIPCHRVLRSNGNLGGFAGGLDVKKALLELEKKH